MHRTVFAAFDELCTAYGCGGSVLEIGAVPNDESLLCLPSLRHASRRIGLNLDGPCQGPGFDVVRGNGNSLPRDDGFADDTFDTVLCNAVLEHDRCFWKTLDEMKRVARPGGVIGIGVPGYDKLPVERKVSKISRMLSRIGVPAAVLDPWRASTLTLQIHNYPGDYYRFSPQAVAEVFLEGLIKPEIRTVLTPPRIIGFGIKPPR